MRRRTRAAAVLAAAGCLATAAVRLCRPDEYLVSVLDIDPEELFAHGVRAVVLDIDNTILPRTVREVPENLRAWVRSLQDAGLRVCLLSNNWHERVVEAAAQLDCMLVTKAVKPLPHGFLMARRRLGVGRSATVVVGDQTFTDILGAHLTGTKALLVTPLAKQDLWHTRLLRNLDRIFLYGMEPAGGAPAFEADEDAEALL